MTRPSSGGAKLAKNSEENSESPKKLPKKMTLLDLVDLSFISPISDKRVNVEECSDAEFGAFISQYVQVQGEDLETWSLEDRRDVINFALENSAALNILPNFFEVSDSQEGETNKSLGDAHV